MVAALGFAIGRARVFTGSDRAAGTGVARLRVARVLGTYGSDLYNAGVEKGRESTVFTSSACAFLVVVAVAARVLGSVLAGRVLGSVLASRGFGAAGSPS